jgi:hypothetical protein
VSGIVELVGAGGAEQVRYLVLVEIGSDRQLVKPPSVWKMKATFSCSTSRRVCSTVLGGCSRRRD